MTAHDVRPKSKTSNRQETVRVIVRCRPLSTTEISQGHSSIVSLYPERGLIELKNPSQPDELSKDFTFDAIYGASSKQKDLYDETFRDLVDSVLNGFNGTIFAYGQTGTGKTYTMEGKASIQDERGVIYNCFDHIFQHISQSRNQKYLVRASYLEIYQEEIRDLLDKDGKKLELKERPDVGVYVKDLSSSVTKSVEELKSVMLVGNANRSVGRTNMNEHSSRSHAIFMVTIECCEVGIDGENHIRVGRLNLVDLAGSERQAKTGASGERFKEATKINLSLSALGNVISSLVDGKSSHIPYRDSKLTRLLQDSLGGNSKTVMVACIGPASYNYEETLGTLRYANRAKNIKNKPRINEDPKDALLREFQDEINRLRAMLTAKKGTKGTDGARGDEYYNEQHRNLEADKRKILSDDSIVKEERKRILEALDKRSRELNAEKDSQAKMSEKIKAMESKLLGGTNLLDHTREQESLLEHQRKELADQKRKEREILEILEQQDEGTAEIHQTFTNLQQEVDAKTKKLNKFKLKLRKLRNEIHDTAIAHSQERQELERDVSEINKELKLKLLIVDNFVPNDVRQRVKELAVWSEEDSIWNLPGARPLSGTSRPSTSDAKGNILVVDGQGVFTRSTGNDSGVGSNTSSSSVSKDDYLDRRPVSIPGLRRPMSSYEKLMVEQAREQMSGQRRPFINSNHPVEPKLNEDIIRFCGENVLVFSSLERLYPNVMDYYEDSSNALGATPILESNVVIDASKSSPSHFSRLRSPSVDSRSRSKNGDARNALPKTHASMYPKARVTDPIESIRKAIQMNECPKFTSASSTSSESSEGICADYSSKGARSMTSSLIDEDLWIDIITPRYGHIYNIDQSFDFSSFKQTSSPLPCSPSVSMVMSSSVDRTPRSTRIPALMTRSCSASVSSGGRLRKDLTSASAPVCGSVEQLCEPYVCVSKEAKSLLERSRQRTPLRTRVFDSRCLMSTRSRSVMTSSMFSSRSREERPRLLSRPRWNRFDEDVVDKTAAEFNHRSVHSSVAPSRLSSRPRSPVKEHKPSVRVFRRRNSNGGFLKLSAKRMIAWYRITSTKCRLCRCDQRLHRLSCHSTREKTSSAGISKKGVVTRSHCVCREKRNAICLNLSSSSSLHRLYDVAALFAAIAFLLHLILSILF